MVLDPTNASKFRNWVKDAQPEDLLSIAPVLFSRIATFDQIHQDRFFKEIKSDPQAKRVFDKMHSYAE